MKLLIIFCAMLLLYAPLVAQQPLGSPYGAGAKITFVRKLEPQMAIINPDSLVGRSHREQKQTTVYYDGLGRPVQTVVKQGSLATGIAATDLVTPVLYDSMGRPSLTYLPFGANATGGNTSLSDGLFKSNPYQQQVAFYNTQLAGQAGETNLGGGNLNWAYSHQLFEKSPLGRQVKQLPQGASWIGSGRGTRIIEAVNTDADSVKIITWTYVASNWSGFSIPGQYPKGTLFKTITVDEAGRCHILFRTKGGQPVLEKRQVTAAADTGQGSGHVGWQCVYKAFDPMGRMRLAIQPVGVDLAMANSWNLSALSGAILTQQCFRYEYDGRGLMIRKMEPGGKEESFVYDRKERLVQKQTGVMKAAGSFQWQYFTYDELNRPVSSGVFTSASNVYSDNANAANASGDWPDLPSYTYEEHTLIHYDNYKDIPGGLPATLTSSAYETANFLTSYNSAPHYAEPWTAVTWVQNRETWRKVRVLGTSDYIYEVSFYDKRGRKIQTVVKYPSGALTRTSTQFNFRDKPVKMSIAHAKTGANNYDFALISHFNYDDAGRVLKLNRGFTNMSNPTRIFEHKFDALGQMVGKNLGNADGQSPDNTAILQNIYEYNVRGWVTAMNKSYATDSSSTLTWSPFGYQLFYDKTQGAISGTPFTVAAPMYNGSIASMIWKSYGDSRVRRYDYTYDALDRLTAADFREFSANSFSRFQGRDYSMSGVSYDKNGNILTLNQRGWKPGGAVTIDSLLYSYVPFSSQLKNVLDRTNDTATALSDFRSSKNYITALGGTKTTAATDFGYDANGNLTSDKNKDLQVIQYNFLNLPTVVNSPGRGSIIYGYDATGQRIKKIIRDSTGTYPVEKTFLYYGAFCYESQQTNPAAPSDKTEVLTLIEHEEGRIRFKTSTTDAEWDWFIKDHLGNVRQVWTNKAKNIIYPDLTFEGQPGSAQVQNQDAYYENRTGQAINVAGVRISRPAAMGDTVLNGHNVHLVRRSTGSVGAAKLLKVMPGQYITATVEYFYPSTNTDNSGVQPLNAFLTSMASAFSGASAISDLLKGQGTAITNTLLSDVALASMLNKPAASQGANQAPKAYLHVLYFDEQFNFDPVASQVGVVAYQPGQKGILGTGFTANITKSGYAYIYYSNESDALVYFDNLKIGITGHMFMQDNHYYPFGLIAKSISAESLREPVNVQNNRRFNDASELHQKEMKNVSLEWYMTDMRPYDPQLGRWNAVDTKPTHAESPYVGMRNNPIRYNDPMGDTIRVAGDIYAQVIIGAILQKAEQSSAKAAKQFDDLKRNKNTVTIQLGGDNHTEATNINKSHAKQQVERGDVKEGPNNTGGSGSIVTFKVSGTKLITTNGVEVNPVTDFMHEVLGHAGLNATGDNRGGDIEGLDEGEWQATHIENDLRAAAGLSLRLFYKKIDYHNIDEDTHTYVGDGPRMVDRKGNSIYKPGFNYYKENPRTP
ncbi:DUF6443 domain-containing protein [Chitinophaga barathri]|uniref:DUF6443 domain-containing protein n=1 Tax=Chitinophaga barathri TaxID=1647451 RepID=A0A3N4MSL3_9BACT|nr:DUF6443 domain-containing protein [Chitinophaga barathri]RPD43130.1 hypothetical protein EG028_02210 [Chitinophaga barathri]